MALLLSCGLLSLPVLTSMVVVKHAGVSLSGPRYTPLDDNMLYVRWDEGRVAGIVAAARLRAQRVPMLTDFSSSADDGRDLVAVWDVDPEVDLSGQAGGAGADRRVRPGQWAIGQ